MKFQCVFCLSTYNATNVQLGESINCPNCSKNLVVPKKAYDRGRVIGGDFVIDRVLGTGGMGTVYLAKQTSLEREVALKVLSRKFSVDPKFRMEFQREARAASRLTHTNLVQAYAFGEDEGDLFLAMEYVEGVTLGDRLDNDTRLMIDEAMNIIQQVAEGLHFAWTQEQLIHRDIKPDNIMLTADGHVKLTDMGLARTAVELENVTEVSGTPAYMNPEQFTKQAMDCRADIYSLGVCLFHAITGQLPFDSPNVRELARQHIQDKVEFPDKTVDLPNEVKKLIRKMMNKNREDRHEDHENLLHDIYNTRTRINTSGQHIPSVHTLSFNRYEFKNMTPQRRSSATDTVSSTKQLPRRKINPLSSATSNLTTTYSTEDHPRSITAIIMSNILAISAIIAAVVLAFMFGGDSESSFYTETQSFIESIDQSQPDFEAILSKTDELLSREISETPNKKDYYARNRLLEIKNRYLKLLLTEKETEFKDVDKKIEKLKQENRRLSLQKSKIDEENEEKIKDLQKRIDDYRRSDTKNKPVSQTPSSITANKSTFKQAINEEMDLLGKLWNKERSIHRLEVLKFLATKKFESALKYLDDNSRDYSEYYARWFKSQKRLVESAEKVWNTVELNLSELRDSQVKLDEGIYTVQIVYAQTLELETPAGTVFKLTEQSTKTFIEEIYAKICEAIGEKNRGGYAYAISKLDFNTANALTNDSKVLDYAETYIDERIKMIKRLAESSDIERAIEVAQKLYKQCSDLDSNLQFTPRIKAIFGRDVLTEESNLNSDF